MVFWLLFFGGGSSLRKDLSLREKSWEIIATPLVAFSLLQFVFPVPPFDTILKFPFFSITASLAVQISSLSFPLRFLMFSFHASAFSLFLFLELLCVIFSPVPIFGVVKPPATRWLDPFPTSVSFCDLVTAPSGPFLLQLSAH